jgi:hypothetical protein
MGLEADSPQQQLAFFYLALFSSCDTVFLLECERLQSTSLSIFPVSYLLVTSLQKPPIQELFTHPDFPSKNFQMDAFTPQQTVGLASRIGTKQAHFRLDKLFDSMMSGPLLGFGFFNLPPPFQSYH